MFHGELFSSSLASGANTFAQVTYISADAVLPAIVNGMQVSTQLPNLMAVAGVGAHLVHVRPQANSMLPMPYPALSPNNRGSALESPPRFWDFSGNPIPLKPTEEFDIFATQNLGSAETEYVFCLFTDGIATPVPVGINPPGTAGMGAIPGRAFSVHWTATQTLTAGAFTSLSPSFDQTLPAGMYALLGARVFSATGLFFRMLPAMGPLWRPGGVAPIRSRPDSWRPWEPPAGYRRISDRAWRHTTGLAHTPTRSAGHSACNGSSATSLRK